MQRIDRRGRAVLLILNGCHTMLQRQAIAQGTGPFNTAVL